MDCDVVYALDVSGDTPRIVGASGVQTRLEALASEGVADSTSSAAAHRKALRDRVVAQTGRLACSSGCKMVFRQRSVDGRKPHFAHHAARFSSGKESGAAGAVGAACACGGRGGNGHAHIMAQKLLAENIASIEFKYWCPKQLHQLVVRKDPGFTATVEKGARNANNDRVRLDVAVYKDGVLAFAVEVTHTHCVSAASRAGIPYVDVNARETVRRLQSGETTLLCESASGVPPCVACLKDKINLLVKWSYKAEAKWRQQRRLRLKNAFFKLGEEKRAEMSRESTERFDMWIEDCLTSEIRREKLLRRRKTKEKCLLRCRDAWLALARKAFARLRWHKNEARCREQEAQEEEERRLEEQRESDRKKRLQRAHWGGFMQHSGRAQGGASKQPTAAAPKRKRVWETDRERANRHRAEHWEKMNSAGASSSASAPSRTDRPTCFVCKNSRTTLVAPRKGSNGGYGHVKQCALCRDKCVRQGWGCDVSFTREDDALICELLNAYGEPMYLGYDPSVRFFFKSWLAFHDVFSHKQWEALVDYLRSEFTTTMSAPNSAMSGYRGWYKKTNNVALQTDSRVDYLPRDAVHTE